MLHESARGADQDVDLGGVCDDVVGKRLGALQVQVLSLVVRLLRIGESVLLLQIFFVPLRVVSLLLAHDNRLLLPKHSVAHGRPNPDLLAPIDGKSRRAGFAGKLHLLDEISRGQHNERA